VVVDTGLTVMLDVVAPLLQEKVDAPLAVSVAAAPTHIADDDEDKLTVGKTFTVIVLDTNPEHPAELNPVTEYVVVDPGLTKILDDVAPVLHVYEFAPEALNVTELPAHIAFADALTVTDGKAFTVTATVATLVHPPAPVPVTVYVVVEVGLTVILVFVAPVLHE
jgi:hypothetical protein